MGRIKFDRWLENAGFDGFTFLSSIGFEDGDFILRLEGKSQDFPKLTMVWEDIISYRVTNESYREDLWISDEDDYWPFFKTDTSHYIREFKDKNNILKDEKIYHFMIIGEEVIDILAKNDPKIVLDDKAIRAFDEIDGSFVDEIYGQKRLGFALDGLTDFYDIPDLIEANGYYGGSIIKFYDFKTGQVYKPFGKKKNVSYDKPVFLDGYYYLIQGDFENGLINLYRFDLSFNPEKITDLKTSDVNLYNLSIYGKGIFIASSDEDFEIYYPFRKTIKIKGNEGVIFIEDDKVYISAWIEEGWDDEKNLAGPDYKLYEKLIIKDLEGKTLSERVGNLFSRDGRYWLA